MRNFSFGARKVKLPQQGDIIFRKRPDNFNESVFNERTKEIVGTSAVLDKWIKEVRILSPDDAIYLIKKIANSTLEHIDGVVHPGDQTVDQSVQHCEIDPPEKLVRIAVVLACLAPPFAGKMFDAHSDGVLFEAYNRIHLDYLVDRHPTTEFAK